MRGRGGDPNRVVDSNRFIGQFSSRQPVADANNPVAAAPSSPLVGVGMVASAPASTYPTPTVATVDSMSPSTPTSTAAAVETDGAVQKTGASPMNT